MLIIKLDKNMLIIKLGKNDERETNLPRVYEIMDGRKFVDFKYYECSRKRELAA